MIRALAGYWGAKLPGNVHYRTKHDLKTGLEQKILTEIGLVGLAVSLKCSKIGANQDFRWS